MFDPVRPFGQNTDPRAISLQDYAADPNGIFQALRQGPSTFMSGSNGRQPGFTGQAVVPPIRPQQSK